MFDKAIAGKAEWIGIITWNDYTESWVAPSKGRGTAIGDVIAYYTTYFKTGSRSGLTRDALYYFHRSQRTDAPYDAGKQTVKMAIPHGDPASNDVELLAFLSAPATLVIRQGNDAQRKDFPAGLASFAPALIPGTTPAFELVRNGQAVHKLQSSTSSQGTVTCKTLCITPEVAPPADLVKA